MQGGYSSCMCTADSNTSVAPITLGFKSLKNVLRVLMCTVLLFFSAACEAPAPPGGVNRPTASVPAIFPGSGSVPSNSTVNISANREAVVYYTTDSSPPTCSSPSLGGSRIVTVSFSDFSNGQRVTIRAIACREGFNNSSELTAIFTVRTPQVSLPTFSPDGEIFTTAESITIRSATPGAIIHYTTDGITRPNPDGSGNTISAPSPAVLELSSLGSGSGIRRFIIRAIATRDNYEDSRLAEKRFSLTTATVVSPTLLLLGGGVITGTLSATDSVRISTSTNEAMIHYTTDGTSPEPDGSGSTISDRSPVIVDLSSLIPGRPRSISVIATREGLDNSGPVQSGNFTVDLDGDDDGLIDINNLNMLYDIRYNLGGTSYKISENDPGGTGGASAMEHVNCNDGNPSTTVTLCGYELMGDLDFASADSYAFGMKNERWLDMAWRPTSVGRVTGPDSADNEGFDGIMGIGASSTEGFMGIFEGNSNNIENLYSRNNTNESKNIGLFRLVASGAVIRNVEVSNASVYGGDKAASSRNGDYVGSLVGRNEGRIIASHATGGNQDGGDNSLDYVGGLVGWNHGTIIASYSTASPAGGSGTDYVGGLVGRNESDNGIIIASHATGNPDGGVGNDDVGGLVGHNNSNSKVIASYATGNPAGGADSDNVGGLLGQNAGTIIASYATGAPAGGADTDRVGGLVGQNNRGTITASYAAGTPNGGTGSDNVGGLVGQALESIITASYAIGTPNGEPGSDTVGRLLGVESGTTITSSYGFGTLPLGESVGSTLGAPPMGVTIGNLTVTSSGTTNANRWSAVHWDFGDNTQNPALKYADYDGGGTDYACSNYPSTIPGISPSTTLTCGTTLVGGNANQGR